ncbi:MAG: hypothetical protein Q7U28_16805 [Aquabacterium sp.]|nr:hypothetical protein [Aquabacterium sp.]
MNKFAIRVTLFGLLLLAIPARSATNMTSVAYEEGWRRARIESLSNVSALSTAHVMACHAELKDQRDQKRLAVLSYSYGGNPNLRAKRLAVVQNDVVLTPGDRVYVNLGNCRESLQLIP